ncbi:MAG: tRNA preQ1(34) S-adenosylmethionine ribosyltransferase-isomerase QueA, partial [Acidobacteriota bacterium]|nr:tRNA preQ1(34) S-adenosylmethionine ribosyltransferase-isomerase QueA [Acidobacteriota bacterium]
AQAPLEKRDQSKMMVLNRKTGSIQHARFKAFPEYLNRKDVLVLNNTRVIPARVWGKKEGRVIEFLFLRECQENTWEVLCHPAKRVMPGDIITFSNNFKGNVVDVGHEGKRVIQFSCDVLSELKKIGHAPLPPYIKRKKYQDTLNQLDLKRYQTVYAKDKGSIAAPTAGLHFTPELLKTIKARGIVVNEISLHVGLATFQPVRVEDIQDHKMLEETFFISPKSAQMINEAKSESRPVIAIGTTSVRAIESAFKGGKVQHGKRSTRLFIYPGYSFKVVDHMLTNFHLPRSTLLMLVSAFAGQDFIKEAYNEAIRHKYRFFSYGDCMLIL